MGRIPILPNASYRIHAALSWIGHMSVGRKSASLLIKPSMATECRAKFLRVFPRGFRDKRYLEWERGYKWNAHVRWNECLGQEEFRRLLEKREFTEVAERAVKVESRTHLLFSFEKMAIRDAVRVPAAARRFANGLYDFLYGDRSREAKFDSWRDTVAELPHKLSRVLTWPTLTVFGFIAQPENQMFFKPKVTRIAAAKYGFELRYQSRPAWSVYANLLEFARVIRKDLCELGPKDMIDLQSFIWVTGSEEYVDWEEPARPKLMKCSR